MLKHAYLIMAYSEYEQLNLLLKMLDYPGNDIYVHIDRKSPEPDRDSLLKGIKYSKVYIYQNYKVYWGDFSQTACEVFLLEEAIKNGYDYYHLLSGADLPLRSQKEMQDFFELNNGKEFVRYWGPEFQSKCYQWLKLYHPLQKYLRMSKKRIVNLCFEKAESLVEAVQKVVGVNRLKNQDFKLQKGATWFSITHALAEQVVSKKDWIYHTFQSTRSSDEIFLQTILINSELNENRAEKTYEIDGLTGLRYIDWKRGKPYTFRNDDFEELINCGFFFARKFSMNCDKEIVLKLYEKIVAENEESLKTRS